MPRKPKNFRCSKCSSVFTGPSKISAHYARFPSHATQRSKHHQSKVAAVLPLEAVEPRARRRGRGLKFCPECGHDLQGY